MGLVNSALQIGRSAITSYQSALSVVGNNIANAADPDYTRQRAVLDPVVGAALPEGIKPGGGVALTSLQRVLNEALEERLRRAIGDTEQLEIERQMLDQVEAVFDELGDEGISARLTDVFNALQDVQNLPDNVALRSVVVNEIDRLARVMRSRSTALSSLTAGLNGQIDAAVTQADSLANRIAELNTEIVAAEANGHVAGALRDGRDAALRELSELVDISVRPQDAGTVTVFIGNEMLVQLGISRGLTTQPVVRDGRTIHEIQFADGSGAVVPRGGRLGGLVQARDGQLGVFATQLDGLASELITALNTVHADGQGLRGYGVITGATRLTAADVALADALPPGTPGTVHSGSFFISVHDAASGAVLESQRIDVVLDGGPGDTTLAGLAAAITEQFDGVTATVTADNGLTLATEAGRTLTFGFDGAGGRADTSGVVAALGLNTLVQGTGAADFAVVQGIVDQPELLAVSAAFHSGNTANVQRFLAIRDAAVERLNGRSITEAYDELVVDISTRVAGADDRAAVAADLQASLQAQRDSISGVNLDEEAVNLLKYERAFQGAARFTTVVDQLIAELLSIVR